MRIPNAYIKTVIGPLFALFLLLGVTPSKMHSQSAEAQWKQVMRGEGFVVDVDPNSLTLKDGRTIGANFRMGFSEPESVGSVKFKFRIDKYEFDTEKWNYRTIGSRYYNSNGREITTLATSDPQNWKPIKGTAHRYIAAARELPPFGTWKVITYTYGDGSGPRPDDAAELSNLRNKFVLVNLDVVRAGKTTCDRSSFELRHMQDSEVEKRVSVRLNTLSIAATSVRTLLIRCQSLTSLMFLTSPGKAVLLWGGVFLSMEREDRSGFTFPPLTIK